MNRFYDWSTDAAREIDYSSDYELLQFMDRNLFHEYEPTLAAGPAFRNRLHKWLDGVPDETDQKLLFRLTRWIYYVSAGEFLTLYSEAFSANFSWWLADQLRITDFTQTKSQAWDDGVKGTWFCPISDSMNIAKFHHMHGLQAQHKPPMRTMAELGSRQIDALQAYMKDNQLIRLVLLEDFIGSGRQAKSTIDLIKQMQIPIHVLICPLIICPTGARRIRASIKGTNMSLSPVLELKADMMLGPTAHPDEPEDFAKFRDLLKRLSVYVHETGARVNNPKIFGFESTGSLTVLNTNCPNNVPPVIHETSPSWHPLFPRIARS